MRSRAASFRFTEEEFGLLRDKAHGSGVSMTRLIVEAVRAYDAPDVESVVDDLSRRMAALEEMANRAY
jgi:hypothetical protein